jgi:probable F420-dependent oxidoreductase
MQGDGAPTLTVGLQLPNFGRQSSVALLRLASELAIECGLDGLWASDHIVLVDEPASRYPYSESGDYVIGASEPWFEALTTLAALARDDVPLELGTSVCVVATREPLLLAKQIATIDQLCGGRFSLGVGIGWLAEEFAAVGARFSDRARVTDETIAILRQCWTEGGVAGGVRCEPRPVHGTVPVLVGGNSDAALRRVARLGDGWYGAGTHAGFGVDDLVSVRQRLAAACADVGRDPSTLSLSVRCYVSDRGLAREETVELWRSLAEAGLDRITVDVGWHDGNGEERVRALGELASRVKRALDGSHR